MNAKTPDEIWDEAVMACWAIAHENDERCCGDEGVMAGSIARDIEGLLRDCDKRPLSLRHPRIGKITLKQSS